MCVGGGGGGGWGGEGGCDGFLTCCMILSGLPSVATLSMRKRELVA